MSVVCIELLLLKFPLDGSTVQLNTGFIGYYCVLKFLISAQDVDFASSKVTVLLALYSFPYVTWATMFTVHTLTGIRQFC